MEFIDKLKKVGTDTYNYTAEKTSKLAKETKLRVKINQDKSKIEDIYEEIGKLVYQQHIREEETDIQERIDDYCKQIDDLTDEIDELRGEILNLKDKKQCDGCAYEMDIADKFCPKCGKEQPIEVAKEVEIVNDEEENIETVENKEVKENKEEQEEVIEENNDEDIDEEQ